MILKTDFTLKQYSYLLLLLLKNKNSFNSFSDYLQNSPNSIIDSYIILRHDVDRRPQNAFKMAELENSVGIKGTYYFRIVPESFEESIIKNISKLGHEIGYHYEDMDLAFKNRKNSFNSDSYNTQIGDDLIDEAYEIFCNNLEKIKKIVDIQTICMHGSPRSAFDNKLIWTKYSYKDLGLLGEPYFDLDFNEFGYLTDTGRRWNGHKYSIRDKVNSKYNLNFKTTFDIINNVDKLPSKLMITIHPERWDDNFIHWSKQIVFQNAKNLFKRYFYMPNP